MGLGLPVWVDGGSIAASNLTAFLTCLVITWAACALLHRVLSPRDILHDEPGSPTARVERVGGVAALVGITAGVLLMALSREPVPWVELSAAAVLTIMGFMDDLSPQDPLLGLTFQGTVGAGIGWALGPSLVWLFIGAGTALVLVTATRLMDGINALSAATAILWGVASAWLGLATSRYELTLLGLLGASAALGFLPFNTRGARLFLGDSGRLLFGGIFAAGVTAGFAQDWREGFLLLTPLSVYLVDVVSTKVLELARRRPTAGPHRERVYQRLVDQLGLSHPQVVWIVTGFGAAVVLAWFLAPWYLAMPASILVLALYVDLPRLLVRRRAERAPGPETANAGGG